MKEYYIKRNGLLDNCINLNFNKIREYFIETFYYFYRKNYFKIAFSGIYSDISNKFIISPSMAPGPELYFFQHLNHNKIYPIEQYYEKYDENTLFTVIEILYDHIAYYDQETENIIKDKPKKEFAEYVNNFLKFYQDGYYLEPNCGFIMKMPNIALKEQLTYTGKEIPDDIYERLSSASNMYYRYDADINKKCEAINILANILEPIRNKLKAILNSEYQINKDKHDQLIFNIVNNFSIRHNREDQKDNYSKEIWYDWMMQYYTSVIITYYRLMNIKNNDS